MTVCSTGTATGRSRSTPRPPTDTSRELRRRTMTRAPIRGKSTIGLPAVSTPSRAITRTRRLARILTRQAAVRWRSAFRPRRRAMAALRWARAPGRRLRSPQPWATWLRLPRITRPPSVTPRWPAEEAPPRSAFTARRPTLWQPPLAGPLGRLDKAQPPPEPRAPHRRTGPLRSVKAPLPMPREVPPSGRGRRPPAVARPASATWPRQAAATRPRWARIPPRQPSNRWP